LNEPRKKANIRPLSNSGGAGQGGQGRLRQRERRTVTYAELDNQLLRDAIVAVCDSGGAAILSRTSDSGAYSITVIDGDEKIREYPNTVEDCEAVFTWLVNMFAAD